MKKIFSLLILLSMIVFPQYNSRLIIEGTPEEAILNAQHSPDGTKIAFTKSGYQGLWVFNLIDNSTIQISDEMAAGFGYQWASDSRSILTRVAKYENQKRFNAVKIFNTETNTSNQLTEYQTLMPYLPQWMDGDSKIYLPTKTSDHVYNSGLEKQSSLINKYLVYEKGNKINIQEISTNSLRSFEPLREAEYINISLSPDQTKIVFEVMGGNLFVINIDGSGMVDLGKGNRPKWSPDSKSIVYMITEDNGYEFTSSDIYLINADGRNKAKLTNTDTIIEMTPSFSPDGKSILFENYHEGSIYLMNIE
jgi:Tol biopolymer transport system component